MVCHFFVFFAVAENFGLCFSVLFCYSLVLFFCQVAENFRLRFFVFGSCLFCQFAKFFRLCFFSVSLFSQVVFFFLFLFSFSGSVFLCQVVVFWFSSLSQAVVLVLFFVLCPLLLSCVLCLCQVVKILKLWFCGVLFFLAFLRLLCFVLFWLKCSGYGLWACSSCLWLYRAVEIFRLWLLVLFCFLSYFFSQVVVVGLAVVKIFRLWFWGLILCVFCQAVVFGFLSG